MPSFSRRSPMPCSAESLFAWHMRPGAFERLAPPWDRVEVEKWATPDQIGQRAILRVRVGPGVWKRWVAEYREYEPGRLFRDVQISGPFAAFDHRHIMEPNGPRDSWLEDRIEYAPPLGALGQLVAGGWVRRSLENMFAYRHKTTADDLAAFAAAPTGDLRVAVTGASGLVGTALTPFLTAGGHSVTRVTRRDEHFVAPSDGWESCDAVVHLAGAGIADKRWSVARKEAIRRSRVEGTERLCRDLAAARRPPRTLICASAIGIYGDRGDEMLDESSAAGDDFLANVCRDWEAATEPARAAGIRVVNLRFGVVLSARGGALAKMLPPFRMGAGGPVGNGRQWMSWIALDDAIGAIHHAICCEKLAGPVNAVAPEPIRNTDFGRILGRVLSRPAFAPLPAFAARLAFGELADALLLASQRVAPRRLSETGYRFRYPDLTSALAYQLGAIQKSTVPDPR